MNNSSAKQELLASQARMDEYRKKIVGLEETNLGLGQKADSLAASLDEESSLFRAQLRAKEEEVEALQGGLVGARQDYQARSLKISVAGSESLNVKMVRNVLIMYLHDFDI